MRNKMMNERETRQEIVNLKHRLWQSCWKIDCDTQCPYKKHGDMCFAYVMEMGMKYEGFYNNNPNGEPVHETLIRIWKHGMKCYTDSKRTCENCKWRQLYGADCYEQYWARELYRMGWRKKNDKEERLSTTEQQN
jgi:hypothetical protein